MDHAYRVGRIMNEAMSIAIKAVQLYAETHPRPPHVTQRQAAEMLGRSAPTVCKLVRSGKLKLNGAGLIPIGQIDELLSAQGSPNFTQASHNPA